MSKQKIKTISIFILVLLLIPLGISTRAEDDIEEETTEIGRDMEIMINLEGSDFTDTENEEVEEPVRMMRSFAAPAAKKSGPQVASFVRHDSESGTTLIYPTPTSTSRTTYVGITSSTSGVVPVLASEGSRYKIAISGTIGWVDKQALDVINFSEAKSYNYYARNSSGELIHYISLGARQTSRSSINQGKAPNYIKQNQKYLSFDGHYFYPATESGLNQLISDYNNNTRKNSINPNEPFYNYFQFLPARAQTRLNANDFRNYLNISDPYISRMVESEQIFMDYGNAFGGNPALAFATGVHESDFGRSYYARARNNFFGHAAYDSNPGAASTYPSASFSIRNHFSRFWNWNYIDGSPGNNPYYFGGFVGNKGMGMNLMYASDPYWGEKIAAHYYQMDKLAGFKDYGKYTLAIIKNSGINIRKQPNTSSGISYVTKHGGVPIAITKEVNGSIVSGSNKWYQFTSEHLLDSNKSLVKWNTDRSKLFTRFNIPNSQVYIHSSLVDVVHVGTDSKLLTQTNPKLDTIPDIENKTTTVYTTDAVNLRPDWSTKYKPILVVPKDTKLTGYKTENGWFQVQYEDSSNREYIGYLSQDHLSLTKGGKPIGDGGNDTGDPEKLPEPGNIKYKTTGSALRLRTKPVNGSIITELSYGTIVTGGKPLNGWVHVKTPSGSGYVSYDYLEEIKDTPKPDPTPTYKKGDVNGDGKVSAVDYIMIKNHIMGRSTLRGENLKRADVNGDGKITAVDYIIIKNIIMGR